MGADYPMVVRIGVVVLCVATVALMAAWPIVQAWLWNKAKHVFVHNAVHVKPATIGTGPTEKPSTTGTV